MIFDENTFGLGFLKFTSSLSYNDLFGIVEDTRPTIPFKGILTNSLTTIPKSTSSWSTPAEAVTSPNRSTEGNETSLTPFLP